MLSATWWIVGRCLALLGLGCGLTLQPAQALTLGDKTRETAPPAAIDKPVATRKITLPLGQGERHYWLHVPPPQAAPMSLLPLMIVLHGYGSSATEIEHITHFTALADKAGFAVAYPQAAGLPAAWQFQGDNRRDEVFIAAIIADVARHVPLDRRRVYLAGMSNGAQMAARLACVAPRLFAAVVLVAGNYPVYPTCDRTTPLPALLFHGTADDVLPYDGRWAQFSPQSWAAERARLNGCAAKPALRYLPAGATRQSWAHCTAPVEFYSIIGFGHAWPQLPGLTATTLISDFVRRHTR